MRRLPASDLGHGRHSHAPLEAADPGREPLEGVVEIDQTELPFRDTQSFFDLKRWGLGTYRGRRRKHTDSYLNEFVFRYNRRFYRHVSFETILGIAAKRPPTSYSWQCPCGGRRSTRILRGSQKGGMIYNPEHGRGARLYNPLSGRNRDARA